MILKKNINADINFFYNKHNWITCVDGKILNFFLTAWCIGQVSMPPPSMGKSDSWADDQHWNKFAHSLRACRGGKKAKKQTTG